MFNLIFNFSFIGLILRLLALAILIIYLIPLQIAEAKVKNGLKILRIQLLLVGIALIISNLFSIFLIIDTLITGAFESRFMSSLTQLLHGALFLALSILINSIYHSQYNEVNKERHSKIDRMEDKMPMSGR